MMSYMGMALAPTAPRTADATAITILRNLSQQDDFVAIGVLIFLIIN